MTSEQIKAKLQYGDYQTLGKALGISAEAAKMRFLRGDLETARILQKIIISREIIITEEQSLTR